MQTDIAVFWAWHQHFGTEKSCLGAIIKLKRPERFPCQQGRYLSLSVQRKFELDGTYIRLSPENEVNRFPHRHYPFNGLYLGRFGFQSGVGSSDGSFRTMARPVTSKGVTLMKTDAIRLTLGACWFSVKAHVFFVPPPQFIRAR